MPPQEANESLVGQKAGLLGHHAMKLVFGIQESNFGSSPWPENLGIMGQPGVQGWG